EFDKPSCCAHRDEAGAARPRGRSGMIDLIGVSRSGKGKDERTLSDVSGKLVGALPANWRRNHPSADSPPDLARPPAGSPSEDDDVIDLGALRKAAKVSGEVGPVQQMVGERKGDVKEGIAHRCSTVGKAERRPPSWRMVWPVT